jgi:ATP-dependent DNA helicase RecG
MRPEILHRWFTPAENLKGVGEAIHGHLRRLLNTPQGELPRLKDLAFHLPVEVVDRRNTILANGEIVTLKVTVESHDPPARRGVPYRVNCKYQSTIITLTFFHAKGDYLERQLPVGQERVISGKLENTGRGWQMVHPDAIGMPAELAEIAKLEPVYPLTYGLVQRRLAQQIQQALKLLTPLPEWQDVHLLAQKQWPSLLECLQRLHAPQLREDLMATSPYFQRIAYDELLASQLALALIRERLKRSVAGLIMRAEPQGIRQKLQESLPFILTEGQQKVLAEIDADMASGQRMLRLLQGDVGSGKTVVALMAMMTAIEVGAQAALMVPTEILGRQHLAFMRSLGVEAVMLSGNTEPAERKQILAGLENGTIKLVIGTHSLFQDTVHFHKLGMVVIDEQHRFGVNQRLALAEKGKKAGGAHILLMTATPIPRSLTLTLFGDMDVSLLTEKPKGRQPITTRAVSLARGEEVLQGIQRALDAGEKIYWICPLVEGGEEEKEELAAATLRHVEFTARFGAKIGLAHGRMKGEEREIAMARFASGADRLLVATTVVEVGVDVPDATIMVIEHAERFGLAQLHQLRGRVGRGDKPSSCILLYGDKIGEVGRDRLRIMRESNDGFVIAEADLRLRGSGEVLGTKQSGMPEFRFADIGRDGELLQIARDECKLILHHDPELKSTRGEALRCLLYLFEQDKNVRLLGSG